jgi:hypothetical protein
MSLEPAENKTLRSETHSNKTSPSSCGRGNTGGSQRGFWHLGFGMDQRITSTSTASTPPPPPPFSARRLHTILKMAWISSCPNAPQTESELAAALQRTQQHGDEKEIQPEGNRATHRIEGLSVARVAHRRVLVHGGARSRFAGGKGGLRCGEFGSGKEGWKCWSSRPRGPFFSIWALAFGLGVLN